MSANLGEQTGAYLFSNNVSTTNLSQHCCTQQLEITLCSVQVCPRGCRTWLLPPSYVDHYPQRRAGRFQILLAQAGLESAPPALPFLNKHGAAAGLCVSPAFDRAPRAVSHGLLPHPGENSPAGDSKPSTELLTSALAQEGSRENQESTRATEV